MSTYTDLEAKGVRLFRLDTSRSWQIPQWYELDLRHGMVSMVETDESAAANRAARAMTDRARGRRHRLPATLKPRAKQRAGSDPDGLRGFASTGPVWVDEAFMSNTEHLSASRDLRRAR